jgi:hypothetical protein
MTVFIRRLAFFAIGMTVSLSAIAQDDLDSLQRRLVEIEAEQAESNGAIEAMGAQIEALAADNQNDPLAEQSAEEPQDVVNDVSEDSRTEASPPPTPAQPALFPELADESRFILKSQDGFEFGIDGLIAVRYEYNHREDDGTGSSRNQQGFHNTATRINFRGSLYDEFGYWVRLNADEFGADPSIDAAMGIWRIKDSTTLVFGQFPNLLTREQGIPLDKLMVQESSPTNFTFDPFAYKGLMLAYHRPRIILRGIINDGYRSLSNSFFSEPSADWAIAGQIVGMVVGDQDDWNRFNNFTSRSGSDFAWQFNVAFHLQQGDSNLDPDGGSSDDLFLGILESSIEGDGWNFYTSAYYRRTEPITDISADNFGVSDMGLVLQGGVWVASKYEAYSRFDITAPDNDRLTDGDDFRTFTVGANYYPRPHTDNLKVGLEALYMPDAEASSIVEPSVFSSVRASPAGDQWVVRLQTTIRW